MKVNFMCVGFAKCATTTLDAILRQHTQIALPIIKETSFFLWCKSYNDPVQETLPDFYEEIDNKVVGMIEPAFAIKAHEVKKYYGDDIKIIFMMRNPVDRMYSLFKMRMRHGNETRKYYKKCETRDIPRMFDFFVRDEAMTKKEQGEESLLLERGNYLRWIKSYEEEYGAENIKLIFMEEFFKEPDKHIRDVLKFIGAPYEELNSDIQVNEGKKVSKGYFSSTVNRWMFSKLKMKVMSGRKPAAVRIALCKFSMWVRGAIGRFTLVDDKQKMLPETRIILEDYYRDSIKKLEAYTGKDLSEIWY